MSLERDLELLSEALARKFGPEVAQQITRVRGRLLDLASKKLVKSNHSTIEMLVAAYLASKGYEVDVERDVGDGLVCDVYGLKDGEIIIVEIETGFVPPSNALDPIRYRAAREVSKVARYSQYADTFILAAPPYHVLFIPKVFLKSPEQRRPAEIVPLKGLLDAYYRNPPIPLELVMRARLDRVFITVIDRLEIIEMTVEQYYALSASLYNGAPLEIENTLQNLEERAIQE